MLKTGFELPTAITQNDVLAHDVLVYTPKTGYAWVKQARDNQPTWPDSIGNWHCYAVTNVLALEKARAAGFNPTAVYYVRDF
jgi:hypothetical protein